ncbi:hypothetical protein M9H77_28200 [Catharanthus roseus]|uniref:Uncharacterized protein n=1 Tax=Catharanthus roseus TaxID=4058 RepID=A0ACC0AG34_CATRO|nr:hypothetical protein M9H77_28200 [Catharanthus roseus]
MNQEYLVLYGHATTSDVEFMESDLPSFTSTSTTPTLSSTASDAQSAPPELERISSTLPSNFFFNLQFRKILKLRNQLVSHWKNKIRSKDPNSLKDILRKSLSTGVSYMYSIDLLGKGRKMTVISCFREISGSQGMERNIFYLIFKYSYSTSSNPGWGITCRNDIILIYVPHVQGSIAF